MSEKHLKPSSADLGELSSAWGYGGPDYLPYRLAMVAKLLDRNTTRLLAESCGLTVAEWRVLAQLATDSPSSARKLAQYAWVDRAEVSRAAASLVKKGYVERQPNAEDRRSALLFCTPEGHEVFERIIPLRNKFHQELTSQLETGEIAAMEKALIIFACTCQKWQKDAEL